jgi:hypothetical protein
MKSSVYISSEKIEVIGYTKIGKGFTVNGYETCPVPEGTMINGRIIDSRSLADCLSSLNQRHPNLFKDTSLVIDGSSISVKKLVVPKLSKWQYYQLISDDFSDTADNFQELLCDYQMLKTKDGTTAILSCAADKTQAESYIAAFKEAGIRLKSIHIGIQAVMHYIDSAPELQNKTVVINIIDGVTMLSVIFENGVNVLMSRVRLYSDDKNQFVRDIVNRLSELTQFTQSEKLGGITHSFYLGLDKGDLELIKSMNQFPLIKFEELEIFNSSAKAEELAPSAHFAYLNISLGQGSIDLIRSIKTFERFKKLHKPKRRAIPVFISIVAALAVIVTVLAIQISYLNRDINQIAGEIDAAAEKSAELDAILDKTARYSSVERQLELKNDFERSLSLISNELVDLIFDTHSGRVSISRMEFSEKSDIVRLTARSVSEFDSVAFVEALKAHYLIEAVFYTGYSYGSNPESGSYNYNFNIDVKIAAREAEIEIITEETKEDEETEVSD